MAGGRFEPVPLRLELAENRMEKMIGIQLLTVEDSFDRFDSLAGTMHFGHGHRAIQSDHRGIIELGKTVVKRQNLSPIR